MKIFILIITLAIAFEGCKKNESSDGVMIRIENSTSNTYDSMRLLYDTTNYNFGTIQANSFTDYHFLKSLADAPAVKAKSGNNNLIIGPIYPPNTYSYHMLANGKYTLLIFPDPGFLNGFTAKFIKD
jgi:hypothetical protein